MYRVRVATVGRPGRSGMIARHALGAGVLLESPDAQTWTTLGGSALALRLYGYEFQPQGEVRFQPVTGAGLSDLNLDEYSAVPNGASLAWEYSLDGGASWETLVPSEEERLTSLATSVLLRVRMSSSVTNDSPALIHVGSILIGYLNAVLGTYVTRQSELSEGATSTRVYTQMQVPSGTAVAWHASSDGGASWEAMSLVGTRAVDEEWTEYTLARTFASPGGTRVRYKAVMTGTPLLFPRIHSLGATLS